MPSAFVLPWLRCSHALLGGGGIALPTSLVINPAQAKPGLGACTGTEPVIPVGYNAGRAVDVEAPTFKTLDTNLEIQPRVAHTHPLRSGKSPRAWPFQ